MNENLNSQPEGENPLIQKEKSIKEENSNDHNIEENKYTRREIVLIMNDNKPADDELQYLNLDEKINKHEIIKIPLNDDHESTPKVKELVLDLDNINKPDTNKNESDILKISKKGTEEINVNQDLLSKENKALLSPDVEKNIPQLNHNPETHSDNKLFMEKENPELNTEFRMEKDKDQNQLVVTLNKILVKEKLIFSLSSNDNENEKKDGNIIMTNRKTTKNFKKLDTKIEMKDSKIKLNIEDLEKQYLTGDKLTLEGRFDPKNENQMQKLRDDLKKMHACIVKDGKNIKYPLCSSTGWFCCGEKCGQSELEKLGIGMVCYFKILKVFLICFLIITIFNIPLYYIYYNNHTEKPITNYRDALFKTTIGNIASDNYNCINIDATEIINVKSGFRNLDLDCVNGNITSVVAFGTPLNFEAGIDDMKYCTNFTTINNLKLNPKCDFSSILNEQVSDKCIGKTKCTIQADLAYINKNCEYNSDFDFFYFSYQCHTNFITLGYNNIKLKRGVVGFIITGIDIASILVLLICLFIISHSQDVNREEFKLKNISICDYSLHLKNLNIPYKYFSENLADLINHFKSVIDVEIEKDNRRKKPHLVDLLNIKTEDAISSNYNDAANKVDVASLQNCFLFDINYAYLTTNKFMSVRNFNQLMFEKSKVLSGDDDKTTKDEKLKVLEERIKELQENIKKEDEIKYVGEIYLTFRNQKIAKFFHRVYKKNKCVRCAYISCCKFHKIKHLYFRDKWLDLKNVKDEPSNINWQNINYNGCFRFLRKFLSIVIAILALAISFGVVIGAKYSQEELSKEFNTDIQCSYVKTSETLVRNEFVNNKTSLEKVFTYCFCYGKLISEGYTNTTDYKLSIDSSITPCKDWISYFIKFNSINLAIVIVIPVVNSLLIILMHWLSIFEKNKTLTTQLSSAMFKMFIIQFINTGLVILLVNTYIKSVKEWWTDSPIFTGLFPDLDPGWYSVVGVTLLFTMLINMIVPHLAVIFGLLFQYLLRCCDSGCSCGRRTKKTLKSEYFDLYVGPDFPIEVRYAEMLTTIFVALVYSSGIPIMYFCILGYVSITYLLDKVLILRFYKLPPKYDLYMSKIFSYFIFVALFLHFLVGIWIYGNPQLLADDASSSLDVLKELINKYFVSDNSFVQQIVVRISLPHNILCLIFLACIIVIFLARVSFYSFLRILCTQEDISNQQNLEIGIAMPVKSLYTNYQLRKLQLFKLMKTFSKLDPIKSENLVNFYQIGINYDREFIKYKLEKLTKTNLKKLENNFDEEIKLHLDRFGLEEDSIIVGDKSYNIAYIPQYESAAYYEYLRNFN